MQEKLAERWLVIHLMLCGGMGWTHSMPGEVKFKWVLVATEEGRSFPRSRAAVRKLGLRQLLAFPPAIPCLGQ